MKPRGNHLGRRAHHAGSMRAFGPKGESFFGPLQAKCQSSSGLDWDIQAFKFSYCDLGSPTPQVLWDLFKLWCPSFGLFCWTQLIIIKYSFSTKKKKLSLQIRGLNIREVGHNRKMRTYTSATHTTLMGRALSPHAAACRLLPPPPHLPTATPCLAVLSPNKNTSPYCSSHHGPGKFLKFSALLTHILRPSCSTLDAAAILSRSGPTIRNVLWHMQAANTTCSTHEVLPYLTLPAGSPAWSLAARWASASSQQQRYSSPVPMPTQWSSIGPTPQSNAGDCPAHPCSLFDIKYVFGIDSSHPQSLSCLVLTFPSSLPSELSS